MNAQKIALFTDTGTNTPPEYLEKYDIRIAPLLITTADGHTYQSGVDITSDELVAILPRETPKTSLPAPATIKALLEQAKADGYERGVFVTISAGLSATFETVKLVAEQVEDFPVIVVNTLSIGVAAGMVVIAAGALIEEGVPFEELQGRLDALAADTRVYFSTKTLEYLRRGGRITEAVYRLGSMLDIKPVIMCSEDDGHYVVARKARGWERSLATEVKLAVEHASRYAHVRLAICCSTGNDYFTELDGRLRDELARLGVAVESMVYSGVSPDLLVHTGPDLVGIGVMGLG